MPYFRLTLWLPLFFLSLTAMTHTSKAFLLKYRRNSRGMDNFALHQILVPEKSKEKGGNAHFISISAYQKTCT